MYGRHKAHQSFRKSQDTHRVGVASAACSAARRRQTGNRGEGPRPRVSERSRTCASVTSSEPAVSRGVERFAGPYVSGRFVEARYDRRIDEGVVSRAASPARCAPGTPVARFAAQPALEPSRVLIREVGGHFLVSARPAADNNRDGSPERYHPVACPGWREASCLPSAPPRVLTKSGRISPLPLVGEQVVGSCRLAS